MSVDNTPKVCPDCHPILWGKSPSNRGDRCYKHQLEATLIGIVKHWNEFGPEHGFDEVMSAADDVLADRLVAERMTTDQ